MLFPFFLLLIPFFTVSVLWMITNLAERILGRYSKSTRCPYCHNQINFELDVTVCCEVCFARLTQILLG